MDYDVAVVIVTFNSLPVLPGLLDSLAVALDGLSGEVVAVDNGSIDGTQAWLNGRDDCRLIRSTNRGYAAGINLGFASTTAPAVLVLNADVLLAADCIQPLLDRLAQPGTGTVVPRVMEHDGRLSWSLRREPTLLRALGMSRAGHPALAEYVTAPDDYAEAAPVSWALGAVMMIARDCFVALDGWDESYFLYSEETDFCLRGADLGWTTWFEPAATVTHIGGQSGRNDMTHMMQIVNRVRLYTRRNGRMKGWIYWSLTVLSEVSWIARGHRQSIAAVQALWSPARRPPQLACSATRLPR